MSKFSQINRPLGVREIFINEARIFRRKRDMALKSVVLTADDTEAINVMDGRDPGLTAFLASNNVERLPFALDLSSQVFDIAKRSQDLHFLHVTIINDAFETSDENTTLLIKAMTDEAREILYAISPDWVAGAELAVFANRVHPLGGKVISPHVHATVWGHGIFAQAQRIAASYNARLTAGVSGCVPVLVQRVRATQADLERVVVYPYRPPVRTKTVYHNPETGHTNLHESEAGDRYVRYLRMYQLLSQMQQDRLCFSSGAGVEMRRAALSEVHRRLELTTQRGDRAEQIEWVEHFWCEFMPRIRLSRFAMPKIVTR
ncbi:hypothetical protein [Sphingomonas sp. PB4P5]|uniref:hypothetical protein n=1 Tax=Parasphingomonas puruogangriensis TaxID=3096155 RepID=UPI002FC7D674